MTLSPGSTARLQAAIAAVLNEAEGRDPRFRYFECRTCRTEFMWTTERMGDGRFASAVLVPKGKGSRSGEPSKWVTRREVHTKRRNVAKARALRLYRKHMAEAHDGN